MWSTSNSDVATVSSTGKVTGVAPGGVTIGAQSEGVSGSVEITVNPSRVIGVELSPSTAALVVGGSQQLIAVLRDTLGNVLTGRTVDWSSSDSAVAMASGAGLVTAPLYTGGSTRTATVIASSEGRSASAAITVLPAPVDSVFVTPSLQTLGRQATRQMTAILIDATGNALSGRTVAWRSSDTTVATVSASGVVTGISFQGTGSPATISAVSEGIAGSAIITVSKPVATVEVSQSVVLAPNATIEITAVTRDSLGNALIGREITWATSDTAIATVSSAGVITGRSPGLATITAASEGQYATVAVTVRELVATVEVTPASGTIAVGATLQLVAVSKDAQGAVLAGRALSWVSSDPSIATVSSTGLVVPQPYVGGATRSVTITAASEGRNGIAAIVVTPVPVVTVTVSPASYVLATGDTLRLITTMRGPDGITLSGRTVTWVSSDTSVAQVSASGVVRAVMLATTPSATVEITAMSEGVIGKAVLEVVAPLMLTSMTAGFYHACGLDSDGAAYCWGLNDVGQLGDGTRTNRSLPVKVSGDLTFAEIDAGSRHTCARTFVGAVYCWGWNRSGELGQSGGDRITPSLVAGGQVFRSVSAGANHSCALGADDVAYCWGPNNVGQLGDGTTTVRWSPTRVAGDLKFVEITAGSSHTCGSVGAGDAYCWGDRTGGKLGDGFVSGGYVMPTPTPVLGALRFSGLSAGERDTCGFVSDGGVYCWGLGIGNTPIGRGGVVSSIAAKQYHRCSLGTGNAAWCWGQNDAGELGNGTTTGSNNYQPVVGGLTYTQLVVGSAFSCGIATGGATYCWGDNTVGQLGDGSTSRRSYPAPVRR